MAPDDDLGSQERRRTERRPVGGGPATTTRPNATRPTTARSSGTVSASIPAVVTILATLAGTLVLGIIVDAVAAAVVAGLAGGLLAATVTATKRRTPGGRAVGSLLAVLAALGTAGALGLALRGDSASIQPGYRVGVVLAIVLATFGGAATRTGAVGDGAVRSALPVVWLTSILVAVVSAAFFDPIRSPSLWPALPGTGTGTGTGTRNGNTPAQVLGELVSPTEAATTAGALSFVGLLVGLLWLAVLVLPRLPIPELFPRDRRETARRRIAWLASRAGWTGWAVLGGTLLASSVAVLARTGDNRGIDTAAALVESTLVPLTMATPVRVAVLAGIVALCLAGLGSRLPTLSRLRYGAAVRWTPAFAGGALIVILASIGYPLAFDHWIGPELEAMAAANERGALPGPAGELAIDDLRSLASPPTGIAIAGFLLSGFVGTIFALLVAVWLLGALGPLSDRAAPATLAASSLVAGGAVVALGGGSTLAVGTAVACALVAWDAGGYGVSLVDEIGRNVPARRPALAHTTGTVLVGTLGIGLAVGLNSLLGRLAIRTGVTVAVACTIALVASLIVLKRRATAAAAAGRTRTGDISRLPVAAGTVPGIDAGEARALRTAGFETLGDIQTARAAELESVETLSDETVAAITSRLDAAPSGESAAAEFTGSEPSTDERPGQTAGVSESALDESETEHSASKTD
ncbi:DUF7519 family protein [Natrialba asiatica]|uniref:Uncharacterized protein n=1 Tax=Natrialba asiatica (strain ATCC 700177 / DSM 12278 / JCM 9576 / FERM P-10747 / NBRC 102637 / 172P1) TaxID=29540 RepID=M0AHL3_NATA1|nr:hypothetical protein [Natrialba asiatica]ELY98185.1 hypothetical protein C481_19665 [Natrialba asiatica DSM 12278]